eukprot:3908132-Lingulodinium_polyedra.AAC.1
MAQDMEAWLQGDLDLAKYMELKAKVEERIEQGALATDVSRAITINYQGMQVELQVTSTVEEPMSDASSM